MKITEKLKPHLIRDVKTVQTKKGPKTVTEKRTEIECIWRIPVRNLFEATMTVVRIKTAFNKVGNPDDFHQDKYPRDGYIMVKMTFPDSEQYVDFLRDLDVLVEVEPVF